MASAGALNEVAEAVRADDTLLSALLREPAATAALGELAAAGPRAAGAEADYAFVIEAVREGYLLHYGEPRILGGEHGQVEPDLALLAGDHLYALGLERLAGLGDLEAVRELSDLISLCAVAHADEPAGEPHGRRAVAGGGRRGWRRRRRSVMRAPRRRFAPTAPGPRWPPRSSPRPPRWRPRPASRAHWRRPLTQ